MSFLSDIAKKISELGFKRAERSGRIDADTAFYRVGPDIWRYVDRRRCIHFYCESYRGDVFIDMDPIGNWNDGIHEPFRLTCLSPQGGEALSETDRLEILGKIRRLSWIRSIEVKERMRSRA